MIKELITDYKINKVKEIELNIVLYRKMIFRYIQYSCTEIIGIEAKRRQISTQISS